MSPAGRARRGEHRSRAIPAVAGADGPAAKQRVWSQRPIVPGPCYRTVHCRTLPSTVPDSDLQGTGVDPDAVAAKTSFGPQSMLYGLTTDSSRSLRTALGRCPWIASSSAFVWPGPRRSWPPQRRLAASLPTLTGLHTAGQGLAQPLECGLPHLRGGGDRGHHCASAVPSALDFDHIRCCASARGLVRRTSSNSRPSSSIRPRTPCSADWSGSSPVSTVS